MCNRYVVCFLSKSWCLFFLFFHFFHVIADDKKEVFITGAAGFIGSNFLKYMYDNHPEYTYTVLDALTYAGCLENIPEYIRTSDRFKFVHGSVTDVLLVEKLMASANLVIHFAAETHVTRSILDDYVFFETDVLGTRALLAALVKHANTIERFIHISTSEVYGTAEFSPMDEQHPIKPKSPYAAAKAAADRLVYAYGCTYDLPVVILRPFNNYGPHQHVEKMIPHFITSLIQGLPLTIHGNGDQKRDWVYTEDIAHAIDKVLHIPDFSQIKNQEINLGSGEAISVLDIAKMILEEFGYPHDFMIFEKDRPGQVELHIAANEKAKKLLNWTPETTIKEGLRKTVLWYKAHPAYWEPLKNGAIVSTFK